jgi:hypothetical protein
MVEVGLPPAPHVQLPDLARPSGPSGTGSSNPVPSSGESGELRSATEDRRIRAALLKARRLFARQLRSAPCPTLLTIPNTA